nr:AarF/UbiB family protein [Pseudoxanthomonas dokdonensis]
MQDNDNDNDQQLQADKPAPDAVVKGMSRRAQLLRFLFKYRNSGIFTGLALDEEQVQDVAEEGTPEQFSADLEQLGPTFIKLGQMLSTRPDFVPPRYATALERMQEGVAPVPFDQIKEVIEQQLGVRLSRVFPEFDEEPLGSASLAQVHRALLRDGTEVAVKVQKPNVAQQLVTDLDLLDEIAGAADHLTEAGRNLRFSDWLQEFRRTLMAELDYVAEAENLERFGEHLAPFEELQVPRPYWDFTRRKVLTMELVGGSQVNRISGLARTEQSMAPLASALVRAYLDQVFVHGEIHADPHPGNLRVTPEGRLAIFDLGMVVNIPPRQRDRLMKLLFAAVDGRGEQVAEEAIGLGIRLEDYDDARFTRDVGQLISRYAAHSQSTSEGRMVLELVAIASACGLRTPPELSLLGKTLLNLDAVRHSLAPELDTRALVEDHLQHVMRARLRKSLSSPNLAAEMMEVQALLRDGPRKLSDVLSLLADNRMKVRLTGLEESRLMENLQKIANRIAAGIVTAALIMASSMMMRIPTSSTLWGYPTVALLLFLLGVGLGLSIVVSAMLFDHRAKRREERPTR